MYLQLAIQSDQPLPSDKVHKKQAAEQDTERLLKIVQALIQDKRDSFAKWQQQKDKLQQQKDSVQRILSVLHVNVSNSSSSSSAAQVSIAQIKQDNEAQLQASTALSAAFSETQKARNHLQQCLDKGSQLLQSLQGPLQQGLAQSVQFVQRQLNVLQQEDPQMELGHTEVLLRYLATYLSNIL